MTPWWQAVFEDLPGYGYVTDLIHALRPPSDCFRRMVTHRARVAPLTEILQGSRGGAHFYDIAMDLYARNCPHAVRIIDFSDAVEDHAGVRCKTSDDIRELLTVKLMEQHPHVSLLSVPDDIPVE
jgi:hypothetical protein